MKRKSPVRHKVTRKTKSGKTVTYMAGNGAAKKQKAGSEAKAIKEKAPFRFERINGVVTHFADFSNDAYTSALDRVHENLHKTFVEKKPNLKKAARRKAA